MRHRWIIISLDAFVQNHYFVTVGLNSSNFFLNRCMHFSPTDLRRFEKEKLQSTLIAFGWTRCMFSTRMNFQPFFVKKIQVALRTLECKRRHLTHYFFVCWKNSHKISLLKISLAKLCFKFNLNNIKPNQCSKSNWTQCFLLYCCRFLISEWYHPAQFTQINEPFALFIVLLNAVTKKAHQFQYTNYLMTATRNMFKPFLVAKLFISNIVFVIYFIHRAW